MRLNLNIFYSHRYSWSTGDFNQEDKDKRTKSLIKIIVWNMHNFVYYNQWKDWPRKRSTLNTREISDKRTHGE
jgi:hypothetical protein